MPKEVVTQMASRMRLLPRSMKLEKSSRTSDLLWRMSAKKFLPVTAAASSNANTNVSMMGETFKYCAYRRCAGVLGRESVDHICRAAVRG